jgi:hypothetical protein
LASYHRSRRQVEKPLETTAKEVSIALSGLAFFCDPRLEDGRQFQLVEIVKEGPVTQESIEMFKELLNISKRGFPQTVVPAPTTFDVDQEPEE